MLLSFDKPPDMRFGLVKEMSDSSRLLSSKGPLMKPVPPLVSMIVLRMEGKEACVEEKK